jgi:hypothetical protein
MRASSFFVRFGCIAMGIALCVACAADAGDPSKLDAGRAAETVDAAGGGADVGTVPGTDSGGGGGFPDATSPPGTDAGGVDATPVDATSGNEASLPEAAPEDVGAPDVVEVADGSACLENIPATCPNCMVQNAGDMAKCEMYLQCFAANDCNPADACASNDGVCGVNTIGGGEAPLMAATQTYMCACP